MKGAVVWWLEHGCMLDSLIPCPSRVFRSDGCYWKAQVLALWLHTTLCCPCVVSMPGDREGLSGVTPSVKMGSGIQTTSQSHI